MTPDIDDLIRQPWEQQTPHETSRNFHCFLHFRHLEPWQRSMRQAYTDHQVQCLKKTPLKNLHVPPDWQVLRFKFNWVARAEAHDRDVAARDRVQRIADVAAMHGRHQQLAIAVQNLAVARLQQIAASGAVMQMSVLQLVRVIDLATSVERRSRGLPTEIVRHENEPHGEPLDLSALSADDLASFEALIAKTTKGVP